MDGIDLQPLLSKDIKIKVSSTLDKSVGRKNLTDGNPETCWTSKQNLPQFISIDFEDAHVAPKVVHLTFQGGFVGTRCKLFGTSPAEDIENSDEEKEFLISDQIFPEDNNRAQVFDLVTKGREEKEIKPVKHLKFVFEESSDPFGRITIYNMQIYGTKL